MLLAKASFYWMMWHVWAQSCLSWTVPTATGGSMTAPMLRIWESAVPQKATWSWIAPWVTHLALALKWGSSTFWSVPLEALADVGIFLCSFNKGCAFWGGMSPGWIGAEPQICGSTRPTIRPAHKWKLERVVLAVSETNLWGLFQTKPLRDSACLSVSLLREPCNYIF